MDNHKLSFVDNKSQIGLNRKYMNPGHVFVRSNCSYPTLLNSFTKRYVVCSNKFVVFIQGAGFTFSSQFVLCMCVHVLQIFLPVLTPNSLNIAATLQIHVQEVSSPTLGPFSGYDWLFH